MAGPWGPYSPRPAIAPLSPSIRQRKVSPVRASAAAPIWLTGRGDPHPHREFDLPRMRVRVTEHQVVVEVHVRPELQTSS
jgi:hypothetical protein